MKTIYYFIAILLFTTIVNAQDFNDYKTLEINSDFSSKLRLAYLESNYRIDYVTANLTFFPRNNEFQSSNYQTTSNPNAKVSQNEGFILFRWENPKEKELNYGLNSKIKTQTNFKKIKEKIKFPLDESEIKNFEYYTKESETVTSNDPKIRKKAAELAQGEDDLFVVVHKIASWTKDNINYSLETLTAEVSQNASWVLDNRKGVCDELTSLFVAMLRSINIPARFVTGQAYTNVINGFGNHAWAEVYFPNYGWIAFDPTYGQMGYVDATHIGMQYELDVKESSVNYAWRSYGVEVNSNELDIKSKVISKGNLYKENVELKSEFLENEVGAGSYVPLQIEVKNLNDYYLPLTLYVTKAPKSIENREGNILLKPGQIKKIFFIIEIPKSLDKGFIYTSSAEITDSFNNVVYEEIKFGSEYEVYTLEEAQEKISQLQEEDAKVYSSNVKIECNKDKEFYYNYEIINALCKITNIGNVNLNNLDLCYNGKCNTFDLDIGESENFNINLNAEEVKRELLIKAESDEVSKSLFLDLNILKHPNLSIKNLNYPRNVNYNKDYKISFTLNSNSDAKDVVINLGNDKLFNIKEFKGLNDFSVNFKGSKFYKKDLNLEMDYKDLNDKKYSLIQEIKINVENVPFYVKYWWVIAVILIIVISMILRRRQRR